MAIHKIKSEVDLELIQDCDIELVFVHTWVFGEVKRVRILKGIVITPSTVPSLHAEKEASITENNNADQLNETKECSVIITSLEDMQAANVTRPSLDVQPTTRRTGRKHMVTDYKKLADYAEDDEFVSPVKHKKPTNLLHKPSRNRQKLERTHRKNKRNKAASVITDSQSSASGHIGSSPPSTISDTMSPKAQHIKLPSSSTITSPENSAHHDEPPDTLDINNQGRYQ